MTQPRRRSWAALVLTLLATAWVWSGAAMAAPRFPPLSGRVVDEANILSPEVEAGLTAKLQGLETANGRQLVVVTLASLQGEEIEEYGYQLGRAWGIGQKDKNDGALFIVAPTDRAVRIEVGYGLEPVLTDALSSLILQTQVLPRFKAGDMQGGVVAGTDAIVEQLGLDAATAEARVQQAAARPRGEASDPMGGIVFLIFIAILIIMMFRGRRRRGGVLPWILSGLLSGGGRGGGWGGGGGGFGGGGFGGGGGSFGGGGASGRW